MSGTLQRGRGDGSRRWCWSAALGWTVLRPAGQYRVTAYFDAAVGLYPGSDVRVLGIAVGDLDDVVPEGDRVRVEMLHRRRLRRPGRRRRRSSWRRRWSPTGTCSSRPSTTAARRCRTAPRCRSSAPPSRSSSTPSTARSTSCRSRSGPTGPTRTAPSPTCVDVGAANLDGNGEALNRTLTGFSQAVRTLAENRDDLFGSVENLQTFTSALA